MDTKGRMGVTEDPADEHRFKVPTLRNVAQGWPYFHDGTARELDAAVRTMAQYQREHQLSDDEVSKVVAFLEALTGEYQGKSLWNERFHPPGADASDDCGRT